MIPNLSPLSLLPGLAGQSQFAFRIRGIPDETFTVIRFIGHNHALSADYRLEIVLQTSHWLRPEQMIGRQGVLELRPGALPLPGIVCRFEGLGENAGGYQFAAEMASPLHPLGLGRDTRVFLNRSVPQILRQVVEGGGWPAGDLEFRLRDSYPLREYTAQFDESDLAFVSRLAAAAGIFFRLEPVADRVRLLFHDAVEDLPPLPGGDILFQAQSGTVRGSETIFALHPRAQLLVGRVECRDYNYRTPELCLEAAAEGRSPVAGAGSDYRYGLNFKTLEEGSALVRRWQQALDAERQVFLAESDCRAAAPGLRLHLTQHPCSELDGEYLVLSVEHQGDQGGGLAYSGKAQTTTYRNKLVLIRPAGGYRPPLPAPCRMHGTLTARVESPGGDYAHLDEQGRYRVRADFDRGDAGAGAASHPVRLLQPYGGDNYGLHFPLHAGTEVVVTCVNGDPDRPVLLGALHNPQTPGPVTAANPSQNIVRTWGGNELLLDDREGKEKIELFTRERKNCLTLDADQEGHRVRLASDEGEMIIEAGRTLLIESGETQTVESGADHLVTVEGAQRLLTRQGEIAVQAATDLRLKAGDHLLLQAEQENIELDAARDLVVEAGENLSLEVRSGDLSFLIASGDLTFRAAREIALLGQGGGTIHLGQGGGAVEIAADGAVIIDAPRVEIRGGSICIKGSQIGNN